MGYKKFFAGALLSLLGLSCTHQLDTRKEESRVETGPGDFVMLQTDGSKTRLSEHLSRVNVLAMWNRHCAPCLKEMPLLEKLRQKYAGDSRVVVLSIACEKASGAESLEQLEKIARQHGLQARVLVDGEEKLMAWLCSRIPREKETGEVSGIYPLTAVADDGWNSMLFAGFMSGDDNAVIELLSSHIEEARRGKLVGTDCFPSCRLLLDFEKTVEVEPGKPGTTRGTPLFLRFHPPLKEEEIPAALADIKKYLLEKFPRLSSDELEQLLQKVKETMRKGGLVQVGTEESEEP